MLIVSLNCYNLLCIKLQMKLFLLYKQNHKRNANVSCNKDELFYRKSGAGFTQAILAKQPYSVVFIKEFEI